MQTYIIPLLLISLLGCSDRLNDKSDKQPHNENTLNFEVILNDLTQQMNNPDLFEEERGVYAELVKIVKHIKKNPEEIFPYSDFDSVIFISYSKINEFTLPLKEREIKYEAIVPIAKAQDLLNIINNPLNYSLWECGTIIPSEQMIFYLKGKHIAELQFACAYGAVIPIPENKLVWGGLDVSADSLKKVMTLKITKHNEKYKL